MNSQPQDSENQDLNVDKTFVEGSAPLGSAPTPEATPASQENPYIRGPQTVGELPSGDDPLPMGSGVVAGAIGAGGMAKIYKIWNQRLEVFRAIKILAPAHRESLAERFETEAKITAKLHHPNIVEIYTVGEYQGLPYIEMELIDGVSLDAVVNTGGRLPPEVCTAIGVFIAEALRYAHDQEFLLYGKTYQGVIHRDLKPANIMISRKGDVKLMDFGIARPTETSLHTVDGNIVGTMQYLSPEQLDGVDIDRRSDIYSFGAILYEILTGTKTFPQHTITNLMRNKATNSYRRFSEFGIGLPPALTKVASKCLELSRDDRYADAGELCDALTRAHNSLTRESPQQVLRRYSENPESFELAGPSGNQWWKAPVVLYGSVGTIVAAAGVFAFLFLAKPTAPTNSATPPPKAVIKEQTPPPAREKAPEPAPEPAKPTPAVAKPEPAPAPPKPATPRKTVVRRAPKRVAPKKLSPTMALQKKYGTSDMLAIGKKALGKGQYPDAITALGEVSPAHNRDLYLLEAYLKTNRMTDARKLLAADRIGRDAQLDLLLGFMEEKQGNDRTALEYYQSALTKPSKTRSVNETRRDALYFTALIHDKQYRNGPSADTRLQALNSWNVVKRTYMGTPGHSRFKEANHRLAEID